MYLAPFLGICLSVFSLEPAGSGDLEFGVNGHPFQQVGYRDVPLDEQLEWVKRLGVGWYRCDWGSWAAQPDGLARLDRLVAEAEKREIRVLPILFPPVDLKAQSDEDEIYRRSFDYARQVVGYFRGRLTHWELHNELDLFSMIRKGESTIDGVVWQWGDADGDRPEHYHQQRYEKARAVLRGLADGVRGADPDAVRLVNTGGWLHTGFVQRLAEDRVPFEILAWHWYSEMGEITKVRGSFDLLGRLSQFSKPIWITEWNRRGGSSGIGGEAAQADYLKGALARYGQYAERYPLEAVFVYELFDEPYFGSDNPESHYGLVSLGRDDRGRWAVSRPKQAFEIVREAIMR